MKPIWSAFLNKLSCFIKKTDKLLSDKKEGEIKLLDNQDLCQLLHVDKRTLQRYRSKGILKYTRIGGKTFYTVEDVNELIRQRR